MVGWHHCHNEHELTPAETEGQGKLVCCSPWGRKESDFATEEQFFKYNVYAYVQIYKEINVKHMYKCKASQVALVVTDPPANEGCIRDLGLIPGSRRSPGGGSGNPLQYSCLG